MVWRHVVERDGFGRGFDERSSERGAEIGRLRSKEGGMDTEWTALRSNIQHHCGCKVGGIGSGDQCVSHSIYSIPCVDNVPKLPSSCTSPRVWRW